MKKLLIILVLLTLGFSCKKPDTYCWSCRWQFISTLRVQSITTDVCDMTERQVNSYEKINTYIDINGDKHEMVCWKKGSII
jgi:hypothetical protein